MNEEIKLKLELPEGMELPEGCTLPEIEFGKAVLKRTVIQDDGKMIEVEEEIVIPKID